MNDQQCSKDQFFCTKDSEAYHSGENTGLNSTVHFDKILAGLLGGRNEKTLKLLTLTSAYYEV